jgi:ADP-ribosylation factor family
MMGKIFGSREMRLLMLGLDAAGKTSNLPLPLYNLTLTTGCSNTL